MNNQAERGSLWGILSPLGILFGIIGYFVALEQVPNSPWWRGYLLWGSSILIIACILYIVAPRIQQSDMPDKHKSFVIGATATLMFFIFLFASLWQLGYTLDKTESPGSGVSIDITYPGPEGNVDQVQTVSGRFSGKLPVGMHAWLLGSGPSSLLFRIWQPLVEIPDKDSWEVTANIGGSDKYWTGKKFELAAVLVNETWHNYFNYYIQTSNIDNYWWNFPLPAEISIKKEIEVIRR